MIVLLDKSLWHLIAVSMFCKILKQLLQIVVVFNSLRLKRLD